MCRSNKLIKLTNPDSGFAGGSDYLNAANIEEDEFDTVTEIVEGPVQPDGTRRKYSQKRMQKKKKAVSKQVRNGFWLAGVCPTTCKTG